MKKELIELQKRINKSVKKADLTPEDVVAVYRKLQKQVDIDPKKILKEVKKNIDKHSVSVKPQYLYLASGAVLLGVSAYLIVTKVQANRAKNEEEKVD
jgi:hypothetical protein